MKETSRLGVLLALLLFVGSIGIYQKRVRGDLHIDIRDPHPAAL